MGRPKKSSEELIASGARAGRIRARQLEELRERGEEPKAPAEPAWQKQVSADRLNEFRKLANRQRETFAARIVPGETIMRELGAAFNWRTTHPLTIMRKYATGLASQAACPTPLARRFAIRFLKDLEHSAFFFDPVAAALLQDTLETFHGTNGWGLDAHEVFITASLLGWRKADGSRRFCESWNACAGKYRRVLDAATKALEHEE